MCSASPALCSMYAAIETHLLPLQAATIQKKRESRHHYKTCSPFIRVQQIRKIVFQKKIRSLNTPVTHHQLASFSNVYECLLYQIDFISILFFDCIKKLNKSIEYNYESNNGLKPLCKDFLRNGRNASHNLFFCKLQLRWTQGPPSKKIE